MNASELPPSLLLAAALLWIGSGLPGLLRRDSDSHRLSTLIGLLASLIAVVSTILVLAGHTGARLEFPWGIPDGRVCLEVDALSAVFLLPTAVIGAAGALYGLGYWKTAEHPLHARKARFFYGMLVGAILLVVTARNGLFFLLAWELMAIAAFFLISTEDESREVRAAGWIYLIATHVGTLCLFAAFSLLAIRMGTFTWDRTPGLMGHAGAVEGAIFLLTLLGCGVKAGVVPLHFWLPGAHANAPSHASALLSAAMLNAGVYGVLRILWMLPIPPRWWGEVLLTVGLASGLYGIAMALGQADLKRMLAYSSIENMGLIFAGIGLAVLGRSTGDDTLVALGLAAALLHVWNHSLFKGLLFFGAGSVVHGTATRLIDRLGGLARRMPMTAACVLVGVLAASGLPPMNGFVSEWLLYVASFRTLQTAGLSPNLGVIAISGLALLGGLALATFAKLYGIVFLGSPRTDGASHAHEAPRSMRWTMAGMAGLCLSAAVAAPALGGILQRVTNDWDTAPVAKLAQPLSHDLWWPASAAAGILIAFGIAFFVLDRQIQANGVRRAPTWGCGYTAPSVRMQYTGRSFTGWLAGMLPPAWMRVQLIVRKPLGLFPASASFESVVADPFESRWYRPLMSRWIEGGRSFMRRFQQGRLNLYLAYIFLTLVALLAYMVISTGGAR